MTSTDEKQIIKDFVKAHKLKDTCPCCGSPITTLLHRIDKAKVDILRQIADINVKGFEWAKLQRDGNLIKESEKNFTIQCDDVHGLRLKWFGLVETKKRRSGEYKLTNDGVAFLVGRMAVPALIACRKGVVLDVCPVMRHIHQVENVILDKDYWDNYPCSEPQSEE